MLAIPEPFLVKNRYPRKAIAHEARYQICFQGLGWESKRLLNSKNLLVLVRKRHRPPLAISLKFGFEIGMVAIVVSIFHGFGVIGSLAICSADVNSSFFDCQRRQSSRRDVCGRSRKFILLIRSPSRQCT